MLENFESTSSDYIPNNSVQFLDITEPEELIIGGYSKFVFQLDFDFNHYCETGRIFISQSGFLIQEVDLNIETDEIKTTVEAINGVSFVTITIKPAGSQKFVWQQDCQIQLKLWLKNNNVVFTEPKNIKVIQPLEFEKEEENNSWAV